MVNNITEALKEVAVSQVTIGTRVKDSVGNTPYFIVFNCLFSFQMFQLAKNARSCRHTWVPVLQRCFSAVALSDHKQIRTMECQNGEKVV